MGLNVSAVSGAALRDVLSRAKAWAEENAGVFEEREARLRQHRLPLEEYLPDWERRLSEDAGLGGGASPRVDDPKRS